MNSSSHLYQSDNTQFITNINQEIIYLLRQHNLLAEHLESGLLPAGFNTFAAEHILDVACGPGNWVLDVAMAHRDIQVVGIDNNPEMIEFAQAQALSRRLDNVLFLVADMHSMTAFPDDSFDLVHVRFIANQVYCHAWPSLLQEFRRVCRPQGTICWIEGDVHHTNSLAYKQWYEMINRAMRSTQHIANIAPIMHALLRNSGWWDIEKQVCAIDLSAGSPAHNSLYRDFDFLSSQACPCLVELERASAEKIEELRRKALTEILLDNFCALWPLVILSGKKAGGETR
jgi:ubiquinone/menaquinone biosynthesis C-methylase UbiE